MSDYERDRERRERDREQSRREVAADAAYEAWLRGEDPDRAYDRARWGER